MPLEEYYFCITLKAITRQQTINNNIYYEIYQSLTDVFHYQRTIFHKRSYLKLDFQRFFVYFFISEKGLYVTFLVFSKYLDCWYDSKHSVNQKNDAAQMRHYGDCYHNTFSACNYMFKATTETLETCLKNAQS